MNPHALDLIAQHRPNLYHRYLLQTINESTMHLGNISFSGSQVITGPVSAMGTFLTLQDGISSFAIELNQWK